MKNRGPNPILLSAALTLSTFGYFVFAPLLQIFSDDDSNVSIAFRSFVLFLCIATLVFYERSRQKSRIFALLPMVLFLGLYTLRLADNFFNVALSWQADPLTSFSIMIGSGLIPAVILSRYVHLIDDRSFVRSCVLLCVIFVIGLGLNWATVVEVMNDTSGSGRAALEKLNPISLASISSSFAIFFILVGSRSFVLNALRAALVLGMMAIAAIAQARGPVLAALITLGIYALIAPGRHRRYVVVGVAVAAIGLLLAPLVLNVDLIEVASRRFTYTTIEDDASAYGRVVGWQGAWDQFLQSPLIGDRVFEPFLRTYPHNIFLEALISLGLVGLALVLAHIFVATSYGIRLLTAPKSTLVERFIALMFFKELVQVQFSGAVWSNTPFWIFSACLVGLGIVQRGVIHRSGIEAHSPYASVVRRPRRRGL